MKNYFNKPKPGGAKETIGAPLKTNQKNGTLKGPKVTSHDVSQDSNVAGAEKASGLRAKEPQAKLEKGGKSSIS